MASSIRLSAFKNIQILRNNCMKQNFSIPNRCKSITTSDNINTYESYYPKIKPEFPEGQSWAGISTEDSWEMYEKSLELSKIPKIKDRLENISGAENQTLYKVACVDELPGMLSFKQYITKTHITSESTDLYNKVDISDDILNVASDLLLKRISQIYDEKYEEGIISSGRDSNLTSELFNNYLRSLTSILWKKYPHILRAQVDQDVRLETFWKRCGYEDITPWATYQIASRISHQIRTEKGLPEVIFLI